MKNLIILILLLCFTKAYCQPQLVVDSTRFIAGNKCCTQIRYSIATSDKGILFVGSTVTKPGGIIPYIDIDTVGQNVFIGKIDSNQQISWLRVYGGSSEDIGFSACEARNGGFAILAATESNNGDVSGYKGAGDLWLLRIDGFGNLLWQRTYGSAESDVPASVASTLDNGFIILGSTVGSDGDVPFHYGGAFSEDWLVIKTDSIGHVRWSKDLGGTGEDGGAGSILSIDSGFYLVGNSMSRDHDCTDSAWHAGVPSYFGDCYVLKLDWNGNVLWDSSYGGSENDGVYNAFFDIRDSSIGICGLTTSNDFMVSGYHGGNDMWVYKINKNGTLLWQKTLGTPNDEIAWSICPAQDSGYMVYGTTPSVIGQWDCWVSYLNYDGSEVSRKIFGGTDGESPYSIVPYKSGYAAVGISDSRVFSEGTNYGRNSHDEGDGFLTYLSYRTVGVGNFTEPHTAVTIYPNPATKTISILTEAGVRNLSIRNVLGQIMFERVFNPSTSFLKINVDTWAPGIYLISQTFENGDCQTQKLLKN